MEINSDMWGILIGHLASIEASSEASQKWVLEINNNLERMLEVLTSMNQKLSRLPG